MNFQAGIINFFGAIVKNIAVDAEAWCSIRGSVKSDAVSPVARHCSPVLR